MKELEEQISKILSYSLSPVEFTFFYNNNHCDDYTKLYSNIEKYNDKTLWDIYSIPSLMRILTLKNEIVSKDCLEEFYKEKVSEICFVLEWAKDGRKIIVFNIENASSFDQELFIKSISEQQENLKILFNKVLINE